MNLTRKTYYDAEPWYQREKTADWYQQMEKSNLAIQEKLKILVSKNTIVTEVACGGGWLAEFISALCPNKYTGFDFSTSAANNAKKRLKNFSNFHLFRADALDSKSYSPDSTLILAHQFLHCLVGNDRKKWLTFCFEILQANKGVFLISSMTGLPKSVLNDVDISTRINKPGNRYYAEDEEIQHELISVGFKINQIVYPESHVAIYEASTG